MYTPHDKRNGPQRHHRGVAKGNPFGPIRQSHDVTTNHQRGEHQRGFQASADHSERENQPSYGVNEREDEDRRSQQSKNLGRIFPFRAEENENQIVGKKTNGYGDRYG